VAQTQHSAQAAPRPGRAARLLVLGATIAFQAWLLLPELSRPVHPLNDDAFHIATALRVREALRTAPATALDPWFSYWSLGYPVLHAYQPLSPLATAAVGLFASKDGFVALFQAIELLLLLAFPLCVYVGARWLELDEPAALGAAAVAPLLATNGLYGLDYGSYLWRGIGLYSQLWAMDLLPLAVGRSWAALRGRAGPLGAAALLAATFLAHAIYGYVAVLSFALAAGLLLRPEGWRPVVRRAAPALALAGALVAFFAVPMLLDASAINHSRWEPAWKWDSYGHGWVLSQLVSGELFDHQAGPAWSVVRGFQLHRLPVLTVLLAAGLALAWRAAARGAARGERFVFWAFLLWVALYCGRPTWGPALYLVGISRDVPLHRLIGAVHLFGVLLAGLALGRGTARLALGRRAAAVPEPGRRPARAERRRRVSRPDGRRRARLWAAPAAALLLLLPAAAERYEFVRQGRIWLGASEARLAAAAADLAALRRRLAALEAEQPGRIYPGLAAGWGDKLRIGDVRVFDLLSLWQMDAVAFLFHAMSLPSDVMVEFDENRPAAYDAFDVRYVVMDSARTPPPFLLPLDRFGRLSLYAGPSSGRVAIGALGFVFAGRRDDVYGISSAWLKSALPEARIYGAIAFRPEPRPGLPLLRRWDPLPPAGSLPAAPAGAVRGVRREGDDWSADVELAAPALVVLKETFHPSWQVEVDGRRVPTLQVTPGFLAAEVAGGSHRVAFRYRPSRLKLALFLLAVVALAATPAWLAASRRLGAPAGPAGAGPEGSQGR
jgi:Bacterial membrane protein YfhO